jgi:hypothetical protein
MIIPNDNVRVGGEKEAAGAAVAVILDGIMDIE